MNSIYNIYAVLYAICSICICCYIIYAIYNIYASLYYSDVNFHNISVCHKASTSVMLGIKKIKIKYMVCKNVWNVEK